MHQPIDPPPEPADELRHLQGDPEARRCHLCNRSKFTHIRKGRDVGLFCHHCDQPED